MNRLLREVATRNGGGLVSSDVLMSKTATITEGSQAFDNAEILGNALVNGNSIMRDFSKALDNAAITESVLSGYARIGGDARMRKSSASGISDIRGRAYIAYSNITDNALISGDVEIYNSEIGCNARILDKVKLFNVLIRGNIEYAFTIEGDAELDFPVPMELVPGTRIHEGLWNRPPLVIPTPIFTTVEGVDDRVQVGCINKTLRFWFNHGYDVLKEYGLEPNLYPQFFAAMEKMRDFKKEFGSPKLERKKK